MWISCVTVFSGGAAPGLAVGAAPARSPSPSRQRRVQGAPADTAPGHNHTPPGAAVPPRAGKTQQLFQITLLYKINKGLLSSTAGLMIVGHHLRERRC